MSRGRWRQILDVLTSVAVIAASAAVVWVFVVHPALAPRKSGQAEPPVPKEPVSLDGAATKGNPAAKIALIVHSDFQCPFCGGFARETLRELERRYVDSGKILIVFRHLPLPIHRNASKAAEAAECAAKQARFWEMHDRLFASASDLDLTNLLAAADAVGLDGTRFRACLDQGEASARVRDDIAMAVKLQITGAPAFLIGTITADRRVSVVRRISGAAALSVFIDAIDAVIGQGRS